MPFEREVFQQIGAAARRNYELLDVAGVFGWDSKHGSRVRHGHVLFDCGPSRSEVGFIICRNRSYGFLPHVRRRSDADLGGAAILCNLLLAVVIRGEQRWFYLASLVMLILFVIAYGRLSKLINQIQTGAAKTGKSLENGRELQASWDRSLIIRVPLLVISLLAQCLVLLVASA
jgi:hypothetical protein